MLLWRTSPVAGKSGGRSTPDRCAISADLLGPSLGGRRERAHYLISLVRRLTEVVDHCVEFGDEREVVALAEVFH
jgi:hypothetical protein